MNEDIYVVYRLKSAVQPDYLAIGKPTPLDDIYGEVVEVKNLSIAQKIADTLSRVDYQPGKRETGKPNYAVVRYTHHLELVHKLIYDKDKLNQVCLYDENSACGTCPNCVVEKTRQAREFIINVSLYYV